VHQHLLRTEVSILIDTIYKLETQRHLLLELQSHIFLLHIFAQSSWLQFQRSGIDSRRNQIFWEVVDLERGPLSLVSSSEELLKRKSIGSGLESREYGRRDPSRWPRDTLYSQKLALTSSISGGRSVGIVHSWTLATEFSFSLHISWRSYKEFSVIQHKSPFMKRNISSNPGTSTNFRAVGESVSLVGHSYVMALNRKAISNGAVRNVQEIAKQNIRPK
jgi:hypothetical protein